MGFFGRLSQHLLSCCSSWLAWLVVTCLMEVDGAWWVECGAVCWWWWWWCCDADERDAVQKKTFTKWINKHLVKVTVYTAHGCRVYTGMYQCVCHYDTLGWSDGDKVVPSHQYHVVWYSYRQVAEDIFRLYLITMCCVRQLASCLQCFDSSCTHFRE